ncbi:hypothetical protein [Intrasporangium flavum]|uniref:hypothetical protein n=1 Tax=Intrasporangium flavum TaxID=1428657 RepID=UPI00096F92F0|nr:hypothetical protein [Intrasporangium flavum]
MRVDREARQGPMHVPTGDPDALRQAARRFGSIASTGLQTAGVRGQVDGVLAAVWQGTGADVARAEAAHLASRSRLVLEQVGGIGPALLALAIALEAAQTVARASLREQEDATAQYEADVQASAFTFTPEQRQHRLHLAVEVRDRRLQLARGRYEEALATLHVRRRALTRQLGELATQRFGPGSLAGPFVVAPVRNVQDEIIGDLPLTQRMLVPPKDVQVPVDEYDDLQTGLPEWSLSQGLIDAGITSGPKVVDQVSWGIGASITATQIVGNGVESIDWYSNRVVPGTSYGPAMSTLKTINKWVGRAGTVATAATTGVSQVLDDNEKYPNMPWWKRSLRAGVQGGTAAVVGFGSGVACAPAGPMGSVACGVAGGAYGQEIGRRTNATWSLLAPTREDTKQTRLRPLVAEWN